MDDPSSALLAESLSDAGFLTRLRCDLTWDRAAFKRLVDAMQRYLESPRDIEKLDREIAELFWYAQWFTPQWSQHPNFPREHEAEYYERANGRLGDLAYWLFMGASPYLGEGMDSFEV